MALAGIVRRSVLLLAVLAIGAPMPRAFGDDPPALLPPRGPARATHEGEPPPASPQPASATSSDKLSITAGAYTPASGKEFPYTATAGYMPLKDESGKLRANIFYVAYTAGAPRNSPDSQPAATQEPASRPQEQSTRRPLIFLFNGGPGAASVWLHLGAVGPRRLDIPDDGSAPQPPYRVVNNPDSWLADADLVFVDPVNTGYSRAADPAAAQQFFNVQEDIRTAGDFIRLYLTQNQRWDCPIYLAGESYGTTRVAGLAPYLQDKVGVSPSGIILISAVLNFGVLNPKEGNDLPYALNLPTYAALAWYHHKAGEKAKSLADWLKDAETFALNDYLLALAKGSALDDAGRQEIASRLAGFTGLPLPYILESNLRIPPERFEKELLRDNPGGPQILGRFDGRLTGPASDAPNDSAEYDPVLAGFYPAYSSAFNEYVRKTLHYDNDLPYEVLSGRTQPWNFTGNGASGYLYVGDDLKSAMIANPHLKLLVCAGRFDLATPYFGVTYTLNHLNLPQPLRKNLTETFFPTGHMVYHSKEGLDLLHKSVAALLEPAK